MVDVGQQDGGEAGNALGICSVVVAHCSGRGRALYIEPGLKQQS